MRTHIEQVANKCRLHINDLHAEVSSLPTWRKSVRFTRYESKQELYDRIDDGLELYKTKGLEDFNSELSQKKGILTLSQSTGNYQITLL